MLLILLGLLAADSAAASGEAPRSEVYVLGTLYRQHAQVPAYSLDVLQRLITAVHPDVLVLDVSPGELEKRTVHPGKIEYTQVVFPLLAGGTFKAYPSEPGQPMFDEIVNSTIAAIKQAKTEQPALTAALDAHEKTAAELLKAHWQTTADVQDATTAAVLAGKSALRDAVYGPVAAEGSRRWNEHIARQVVLAVRENPGRRILVLTGIDNRSFVLRHLAGQPLFDLVDTEQWLRTHSHEIDVPVK